MRDGTECFPHPRPFTATPVNKHVPPLGAPQLKLCRSSVCVPCCRGPAAHHRPVDPGLAAQAHGGRRGDVLWLAHPAHGGACVRAPPPLACAQRGSSSSSMLSARLLLHQPCVSSKDSIVSVCRVVV